MCKIPAFTLPFPTDWFRDQYFGYFEHEPNRSINTNVGHTSTQAPSNWSNFDSPNHPSTNKHVITSRSLVTKHVLKNYMFKDLTTR